MRDVLSGLLGVPATILVAAGFGIAGVTVVSRVRGRREPPIRWRHLTLGVVVLAAGFLLLWLDVALVAAG